MGNVGQIRINTTFARVAVRSEPARPVIRHSFQPVSMLELTEVRLESELPQLSIDGTETRAALGVRTVSGLRTANVEKAWQASSAGIDRIVRQGDALGNIAKNKGSVVGQLARQSVQSHPRVSLDVLNLPLPRVAISPRQVQVSYEKVGGVSPLRTWEADINWTPFEFDVSLDPPGAVDIQYEQATPVAGGGTGKNRRLSALA